MGNQNSGRKPGDGITCVCGACKLCQHRSANRRYRNSKKITDDQLEKLMVAKFQSAGWDRQRAHGV